MSDNEEMHESANGAKKANNEQRMSLVPAQELLEVAAHYHRGSKKYGDHNWTKGMPFSWHYDALMRHLLTYWGGEDIDPETGSEHMDAVVFHALGLKFGRKHHPELDDRLNVAAKIVYESYTPQVMDQVDRLTDAEKDHKWTDRDGDLHYWEDGEWYIKYQSGEEDVSTKYCRYAYGPYTRVES